MSINVKTYVNTCVIFVRVFITIKNTVMLFLLMSVQFISSRRGEAYFWSKENPHFHNKLEHTPPHVTIRAAISGRYIFGQYFLECSVNQHTYLTTLKSLVSIRTGTHEPYG
jgi:hypothetical protein